MPNNNEDGFDTPLDAANVPGAPTMAQAPMPVGPPAGEGVGQAPPRNRQQPPQKMPALVQEPAPEPIVNRYAPYMMPKRVGLIDNETQQPIIEAGDINEVMLATLSDILNRLERIERSL